MPTDSFHSGIEESGKKWIQLQGAALSPAGIAQRVMDLFAGQIHDDGQAGDNLLQRRLSGILMCTDRKRPIHMIAENFPDTFDIDAAV